MKLLLINIKNKLIPEKGSTLLITLVTIVLISIFGMTMTSMTLNSRAQYNKAELSSKTTDIAEMGITHYDHMISEIVADSNTDAKQQTYDYIELQKKAKILLTADQIHSYYVNAFCNKLLSHSQLNSNYNSSFYIEGNVRYKIKYQNLLGDCHSTNVLEVEFLSTGIIDTKEKPVQGTIFIKKHGNSSDIYPGYDGGSKTSPRDYTLLVSEDITCKDKENKWTGGEKECEKTYTSSVYFMGEVNLDNGSRELKVEGDTFFNKGLNLQGSSAVIIDGDAYFNPPYFTHTGNAYGICVTGQTYKVNTDGSVEPFQIEKNTCSKTSPTPKIDPKIGINWDSTSIPLEVKY